MTLALISGLIRAVTLLPRLLLLGVQKALGRPAHVVGQAARSVLLLPIILFRATRTAFSNILP